MLHLEVLPLLTGGGGGGGGLLGLLLLLLLLLGGGGGGGTNLGDGEGLARLVDNLLGGKDGLSEDGDKVGLAYDVCEPTGEVGVGLAGLGVEDLNQPSVENY